MKSKLFAIAVCLLLAAHTLGQIETNRWGALTNDLQMSIRLKGGPREIKRNEAFKLLVGLRNASTNEMFCVHEARPIEDDPSYSFHVISPSGRDVSPGPRKGLDSVSGRLLTIPPNQTTEFEFDLSSKCRFDEEGIYSIIAERGMRSTNKVRKAFQVVSNPLKLTVILDH